MKKHHIFIGGTMLTLFLFIILPTGDLFDVIVGAMLLKFFGIYAFIYFIIFVLFIATLVWYYGVKK